MENRITYQTKTATENDIRLHLIESCDNFVPPLNSRVNIESYAEKIKINAITFEAWNKNTLIGLIAAYFNTEGKFGFITSVSTSKAYMGIGIASELLKMCLDYARKSNYNEIRLEVNKDNTPAINFYKKHNFIQTEINNESLFLSRLLNN